MISCFIEERIPFMLIFTKIDKSNQKDRSKNQKLFHQELEKIMKDSPVEFYVDNVH